MPSKPARKLAGIASSPWTSIAKSTPVSSIALRTHSTSGLFSARRRVPFAVEVHADGVGAQVAAARAVGVHVGDDVEGAFAAQHAGDRIVLVGQLLERAFHPPFGHRLAGMLAGVEPDVERAFADASGSRCPARRGSCRASGSRRPEAPAIVGDEIVVPLHRIRREIGDPDEVLRRACSGSSGRRRRSWCRRSGPIPRGRATGRRGSRASRSG